MLGIGFQNMIIIIQQAVQLTGIAVILSGVIIAIYQYVLYLISGDIVTQSGNVNLIRLNLGRLLILGLEFIVAGDLIGTIQRPDYYDIGILAIIVVIRTILSFSINKELMSLSQEK